VVPADLGWSDIGSWSTVWEVLDHDAAGNAIDGPVVMLDSRNSLVRSEDQVLTTVVGLDDVIVVSTADAVLVAARAKAEQVKALVEELKRQNQRAAVEHRRIYRPWGYYQDVDLAERYRVKRIVVKPGNKLSLQKHFHRSEHWVVVHGTAEVTLGSDMRSVHENESIYIPIGSVHRLANPGKIPLELIEVRSAAISARTTSCASTTSMAAGRAFSGKVESGFPPGMRQAPEAGWSATVPIIAMRVSDSLRRCGWHAPVLSGSQPYPRRPYP
jgi:mannose-1-phosphate guanylyltransferase/mannose-6-phosphate isomerase